MRSQHKNILFQSVVGGTSNDLVQTDPVPTDNTRARAETITVQRPLSASKAGSQAEQMQTQGMDLKKSSSQNAQFSQRPVSLREKPQSNVMQEFEDIQKRQQAVTQLKKTGNYDPDQAAKMIQVKEERRQTQMGSAPPKKTNNFPEVLQESTSYFCDAFESLESKFRVRETQRGLTGTIYITSYKLKFVPEGRKVEPDLGLFNIPYSFIYRITESMAGLEKTYSIHLTTKDERVFKFKFDVLHQYRACISVIKDRGFPDAVPKLMAGKLKGKLEVNKVKRINHKDINNTAMRDFNRLGISSTTSRFRVYGNHVKTIQLPNPTYLPASITDEKIDQLASQRKCGRFPTVTYVHRAGCNKEKRRGMGCTIWRSAEPLPELSIRQSKVDEEMIKEMTTVYTMHQDKLVRGSPMLYIFTARPETNTTNVNTQFGMEHTNIYPNIQRYSYNFQTAALSAAFASLCQVSQARKIDQLDSSFMRNAAKTEWYQHVENILIHSQRVFRAVHELNGNVLIYDTTGTSCTPVLSSLAQIFCDPYYRTFEGFKVLVHKEWVFYKHNFAQKGLMVREYTTPAQQQGEQQSYTISEGMAYITGGSAAQPGAPQMVDNRKLEPLFILFLDAVQQLIRMNPLSFEFNSRFLAFLAMEVFTGRHFEFVQNGFHFTPQWLESLTRSNIASAESFLSIFDDINPKTLRSHYLNKGYMSVDYANQLQSVDPILLKFMPKSMVHWDEYFGRYTIKAANEKAILQNIQLQNQHSKNLCLHHMKEANTQLIKKIIRNLEKFQDKRNQATEGTFPPALLQQYRQIMERMDDISLKTLTSDQLRNLTGNAEFKKEETQKLEETKRENILVQVKEKGPDDYQNDRKAKEVFMQQQQEMKGGAGTELQQDQQPSLQSGEDQIRATLVTRTTQSGRKEVIRRGSTRPDKDKMDKIDIAEEPLTPVFMQPVEREEAQIVKQEEKAEMVMVPLELPIPEKEEQQKEETGTEEMMQSETPQTETPQTETPQTETQKMEMPQTETPQTETQKTETPQTEEPKKEEEPQKKEEPLEQSNNIDASEFEQISAEQVVELQQQEEKSDLLAKDDNKPLEDI